MHYIFYHGKVSQIGAKNTEVLINSAYVQGEKEITICLSSEGGDVNSGIGLYNFIQMFPININTHASGICASIAVTIFMAGKKRTAQPLSIFSLHQASFSEGPQSGQRAPNTDLISLPFKTVANWTDEAIKERFGPSDFRFTPEEGVDYRVVTEINTPILSDHDTMVVVSID